MDVYVLWGFLGSGKTTLINYLLAGWLKDRKVVVIENESGKESVDGIYLKSFQYSVVELKSGCVCCSLRANLIDLLMEVQQTVSPDIVIVEPSGLASLEDLLNIRGIYIKGTISLLSVKMFDFLMKLNPDYYCRQFALSTVLFLTGIDEVNVDERKKIIHRLISVQPHLWIIEDYRLLDDADWTEVFDRAGKHSISFIPVQSEQTVPLYDSSTLIARSPVDVSFFKEYFTFINTLFGNRIIRAKGLLSQKNGQWFRFDYVCDSITTEDISKLNLEENGFLSIWYLKSKELPSPEEWINFFLNAFEVNCSMNELVLSDAELCNYLGYGKNIPDAYMLELINRMKQEAISVCKPRLGFRFLTGGQIDRKSIKISGLSFAPEGIITKYLQDADFYAALTASVGSELDEWIAQKREGNDIVESFIADALGSLIVETIVEWGKTCLEALAIRWQLCISNSYSPGYCGWNIAEQKMFFSMFPKLFCGISLTESSLMLPIKSVSSLIGIGKNIKKKPYGCSICRKKDCFKRKSSI